MQARESSDTLKGVDAGRLLQIAGACVAVTLGVCAIVDGQFATGHTLVNAVVAIQLLTLAGFTAAFWYNTRSSRRRSRWWPVALLVFQVFASLMIAIELSFLIAVEIPLIIRSRKAFVWLAGVALVSCGLAALSAYVGDFQVSDALLHTPTLAARFLTVVMMLAWTLFAFSAGYLIVQLEEARNATLWANAQLEGSQTLLADTARIGERLRISRELHDTIGHHLTGLSINLELASQITNEAAMTPVRRAQLVAKMLLAETREVLTAMREDQSLNLPAAIRQLTTAMKDPVCHLEIGDGIRAEPAAARALFRCAQEAMTNAVRHARASNFHLKIEQRDERIWFEARDDGRGVAPVTSGNGLRGMRERMEELGGALEIESGAGRGFLLKGWIPSGGAR